MRGSTYRIYAKPFRAEPGNITDFANRKPRDQNMIMFTMEEVRFSESIFTQAASYYLYERTTIFKTVIVLITAVLLILVLLFIFTIIKWRVVDPIVKLTNYIMKPEEVNQEDLDDFIEKTTKEAKRKKENIKKLKEKLAKMQDENDKSLGRLWESKASI